MTTMQKLVSAEEFHSLFEGDAPIIASYTIGFVLPKIGESIDAVLGGSGTLVVIDSTYGILTAEHVLRGLFKNKSPIGLILAAHGHSGIHQVFFTPKPDDCVVFENTNDSEQGPDLAFIPLDHETVSKIDGKKMFYDLTAHRDFMLQTPPTTELGAWIISGMADEWTKDGESHRGFSKVKEFRGMIGEVHFEFSDVSNGISRFDGLRTGRWSIRLAA